MIKMVAAAVTLALVSAAIIVWATVIHVEPKATLAVKEAQATDIEAPMLSPFELMRKQGKNLPAEQWDAF